MKTHWHIETFLNRRPYSTTATGWDRVQTADAVIRQMRRDPERRRGWAYKMYPCLDACEVKSA